MMGRLINSVYLLLFGSDEEGNPRKPDFSSVAKESDNELERSENIQLLIAIGILGLAGTLVSQGLLSFPLLSTVAELSLVKDWFRVAIYIVGAFLSLKAITSVLYPLSDNQAVIIAHEIIPPALLTIAVTSIPLMVILGGLSLVLPSAIINLLQVSIVLVLIYTARRQTMAYQQKRSEAYEKRVDKYRTRILEEIHEFLGAKEAWAGGVSREMLLEEVGEKFYLPKSYISPILDDLTNNQESPISYVDSEITVESESAYRGFLEERYSSLEVEQIIGVNIKGTPAAQPEEPGEAIYYCHDCKKLFASSELTALQEDHLECPECFGGLDLHSSAEPRRSTHQEAQAQMENTSQEGSEDPE